MGLYTFLDPVVLFFLLGFIGKLLKVEFRLPGVLYEILSVYLLLSIGLKGGVELSNSPLEFAIKPIFFTLLLGIVIPSLAFYIAKSAGRTVQESVALAAFYGSTSAVTFAVALSYLDHMKISYEPFMTVLLVCLEVPGIAVAFFLLHKYLPQKKLSWGALFHEVLLNKSIYLLLGGLIIGFIALQSEINNVKFLFVDLFRGFLCFFMLEMGLISAERIGSLREKAKFILAFGILVPILSGTIGAIFGSLAGLGVGGSAILATLSASASYIAAPAAVRLAMPGFDISFPLTAALGVTFPFNVIFGIPIYTWIATHMVR